MVRAPVDFRRVILRDPGASSIAAGFAERITIG
jgi:hypothetical protein